MSNLNKKLSLITISIIVFSVCSNVVRAQYEPFGVYTNDSSASGGGVTFNFYPSGYSDGFWWGETDRHYDEYEE